MTDGFDHTTFLSPFTWRYGTPAMRRLWSQEHQRRLWRRVWVALAEAQAEFGLVTAEQVADLRAHEDGIDLARACTWARPARIFRITPKRFVSARRWN
jgi:adenylosuccinate lyase